MLVHCRLGVLTLVSGAAARSIPLWSQAAGSAVIDRGFKSEARIGPFLSFMRP